MRLRFPDSEFFPLANSASGKVAGMPAISLKEKGVPWFFDVKDRLLNGIKTIDLQTAIAKEAQRAAVKGATALFIYNSGDIADSIVFNPADTTPLASIPLVYITKEGYNKYLTDPAAMLDIELNIAFGRKVINASNLAGYINNNAANTVVIATTYSCNAAGASDAENCATAPTIFVEMAKLLLGADFKSNNYVFVAFDGAGLNNVPVNNWLTQNMPATKFNYVLNICNGIKEQAKIKIKGSTTSGSWSIPASTAGELATVYELDTLLDEDVTGSPFFIKEIPVLNVYALQTDAAQNSLQASKLLYAIVEHSNSLEKFAFAKNAVLTSPKATVASFKITDDNIEKQPQTAAAPIKRSDVSLGIIPDKTAPAEGLRINGVSPKKLAAKIGLQSGDILLDLGGNRIIDMNSYMKALSNFKSGDKTVLVIKRGNDDKEFAVEF